MTLFSCKRLLLTSRVLEKYQNNIYYRYLFGLVLDGYLWIQVSFHGCFLKVDTSALILEGKNGQICANPDKGAEIRTKETLICLELINLSIFAWICPFLREFVHFCGICPFLRHLSGLPPHRWTAFWYALCRYKWSFHDEGWGLVCALSGTIICLKKIKNIWI